MRYVIRDCDGYWFGGFDQNEPIFVNAKWRAMQFDNVTGATEERDALAQMCGDDGMTVVTETIR